MNLPLISVIVVNYNGKRHLEACLSSLEATAYPADQREIILVDNASSDGSVAFVRERFPGVRLLQNAGNLGFAAANNRGAAEARGEYMVCLNNDTRVAPDFLRELVRPCLEQPGVVCTAAKILDWDGQRVDFVSASMNYYGFAFQPAYGAPDTFHEQQPVLFACGGAMLIRRDVFLDCGGFDEDYFIYFEDMDLGWRLWLMGYQVLFTPAAIVYHRLHATMDNFSNFRKWLLFERNALVTLIKNYDEENLYRILPAALLLMFKRAEQLMRAGGWTPEQYAIQGPAAAGHDESINRSAVAVLAAANEVIDNLPQIFAKRARVQARRRRPDAEILPLLRQPLRVHPLLYPAAKAQYDIGRLLGIADVFAALPRQVLVIAGQSGAASEERVETLAEALRGQGHEPFLALPAAPGAAPAAGPAAAPAADAGAAMPGATPRLVWTPATLDQVIQRADPDVLVVSGWSTLAGLSAVHLPVVLDEAGPLPWPEPGRGPAPGSGQAGRLAALARVDFVTCGDAAVRESLLPWLARAGFGDPAAQCAFLPDAGAAGREALDRFCRYPYKRAAALGHAAGQAPAPPAAVAPPGKGWRQLLGEARFHYRRGGWRMLAIETLAYLQRQLAKH